MKEAEYSVIDLKLVTEETILWFGKHKGLTIQQVLDKSASYLGWCLEKDIFTVSEELEQKIDEAVMEEAYENMTEDYWGLNWYNFD